MGWYPEFTYLPCIGRRGGCCGYGWGSACCGGTCCACPSSGPCAVATAGTSRALICKGAVCHTGAVCGLASYTDWVL